MKSFVKLVFRLILYGAVFYLLNRFADVQTALADIRFTYAYPFLSCISVIYGPFFGGLTGMLGQVYAFLIEQTALQWVDLGSILLFCLIIGFSTANRFDLSDGILDRTEMDSFLWGQIVANILVWFIVRPVLSHIFLGTELSFRLAEGFVLALNRALSGLLIGSLLIAILSSLHYSEAGFYRS